MPGPNRQRRHWVGARRPPLWQPLLWVLVVSLTACAAPTGPTEFPVLTKVALDIGHTPAQPGAIGARGIAEYHYNRAMVEVVSATLRDLQGVKPVVINAEGREIGLRARTAAAASMRADILLSFHHDSVQPQYVREIVLPDGKLGYHSPARFSGFSLFVAEAGGASLQLAQALGGALLKAGFRPTLHHAEEIPGENRQLLDRDRGVYRFPELVVLNTATQPSVLVECGVIVNPDDEAQIGSAEYRRRFAAAIAQGLAAYFREKP